MLIHPSDFFFRSEVLFIFLSSSSSKLNDLQEIKINRKNGQ